MIIGKKIKKGIKIVVVLILLAFVYKHNPYQFEFLGHYDKIWAHRVNTLDKLAWSTPFFKGVELDLVYSNGILDITHPPKPSTGLSLAEYLQSLDPKDSINLWLDIKNLTLKNVAKINQRIDQLINSNAYPKELILIESRAPEALSIFLDDNYRCSYYLPDGLYYMKSPELNTTIAHIQNVIIKYPKLEISSHFRDYPIMAQNFDAPKNLWAIQHSRIKDYSAIRTLLADTTVKTVLISYRSIRGNR